MRALTLIRPMAAAIVHGTKRIENRPKNLPMAMRGVPAVVAVHAGKGWSGDYVQTVRRIDGVRYGEPVRNMRLLGGTPYEARLEDEGIVGLMRLTGRVWTHREVRDYNTCSPQRDNNDYDILRECLVDGVVAPFPGAWYSGPFGYEIDCVVAFSIPIPCRGMQGFWPVPEDIANSVLVTAAAASLQGES